MYYGETLSLKNELRRVTHYAQHVDTTNDGEPVYDKSRPLPVVQMTGTVKLHGTNSSWSLHKDILTPMSRKKILIVGKEDNAGFASFTSEYETEIKSMLIAYAAEMNIDTNVNTLVVSGEWAGKGVHKNNSTAIAQLPDKHVFIFAAKSVDAEGKEVWCELNNTLSLPQCRVHNIEHFSVYTHTIDFNNLDASKEYLESVVNEVEQCCPVADALGIRGIGEGAVFTGYDEKIGKILFKVKGLKHSSSKVKTVSEYEIQQAETVNEFAGQVVTVSRIEQALNELELEATKRSTGKVVQWVYDDVIKEEQETMKASQLTNTRALKSAVQKATRELFFKYLAPPPSNPALPQSPPNPTLPTKEDITLEREADVASCTSLIELGNVIESFADEEGMIEGTTRKLDAERMAYIATDKKRVRQFTSMLTRHYGIRKKAVELIDHVIVDIGNGKYRLEAKTECAPHSLRSVRVTG